jgi:hypothetical protein
VLLLLSVVNLGDYRYPAWKFVAGSKAVAKDHNCCLSRYYTARQVKCAYWGALTQPLLLGQSPCSVVENARLVAQNPPSKDAYGTALMRHNHNMQGRRTAGGGIGPCCLSKLPPPLPAPH